MPSARWSSRPSSWRPACRSASTPDTTPPHLALNHVTGRGPAAREGTALSSDPSGEWDFDPAVRRAIRSVAQRLAHGPAFSPQEAEDIEQDLAVTVLSRQHGYDPARGEP